MVRIELLWLFGDVQFYYMGKASVLLVEVGFQELLYEGWLIPILAPKKQLGRKFGTEAGSYKHRQVVQCRILSTVQFV